MFNNIYLLFIIIVSVHGLDCGEWPPYDQQLMLNTMNGFSNATYTFECCGALSGPTYDCNSIGICNYQSPVLCIGGNKQQHACSGGTCSLIDWTSNIASPCPQVMLNYASIQPKGLNVICCDNSNCIAPTLSKCGQSSSTSSCSSAYTTYLCVNDGFGIECVNPLNNHIYSGNYSNTNALPTSSSTSTNVPNTSTPTQTASVNGSTSSNLSIGTIVGIVAGVLGAISSLVGIIIKIRNAKRKKQQDDDDI